MRGQPHSLIEEARDREYGPFHAVLQLKLSIDKEGVQCDRLLLHAVIASALVQLFGKIGGALWFDVISCDSLTGSGTLRIDHRDISKLTAAAACVSELGGAPARAQVLSVE